MPLIVGSGTTINATLPADKTEGQPLLFSAILPPGASEAIIHENGVPIATLSAWPYLYEYFPPPGSHQYKMTFDVGEDSGIGFVTVIPQPPVLIMPESGVNVVGATIPLEATVFADDPVTKVEFWLDFDTPGATLIATVLAPPWTDTYDSVGLPVGDHEFTCFAYTAYGATECLNPATITFSLVETYPGETVPEATYIWWGGDGSTFVVDGTPSVTSWTATRGGQGMTAVALPDYQATGFNGKPCVTLNGTSQYLTSDGTVPPALQGAAPHFTVLMEFQFTSASPPSNTNFFSLGNTADGDSQFIVRTLGTSGRIEVTARGNSGASVTLQSVSGVLDDDTACNVLAVVVTGTECRVYLNGVEVEMNSNAMVFPTSVTWNRLSVGAQRLNGTASLFAPMRIRAVVIADTALSTPNLNTIQTTMILDAN